MATDLFQEIPTVDIDDGVFKYVLIKVYKENTKGEEACKFIVRGYTWASFHADIYEKVDETLRSQGFECECVGGGRIRHQDKAIHVYGYSLGYGLADHAHTVRLLQAHFPTHSSITCSNEGY